MNIFSPFLSTYEFGSILSNSSFQNKGEFSGKKSVSEMDHCSKMQYVFIENKRIACHVARMEV